MSEIKNRIAKTIPSQLSISDVHRLEELEFMLAKVLEVIGKRDQTKDERRLVCTLRMKILRRKRTAEANRIARLKAEEARKNIPTESTKNGVSSL
jgi:hypothetical protein